MKRLALGRLPLYTIGIAAHWALYMHLLMGLAPVPQSDAVLTAVVLLMLAASGIGALMWPVIDHWLMAALALTVTVAAMLAVATAVCLTWLAAFLHERIDDALPFR